MSGPSVPSPSIPDRGPSPGEAAARLLLDEAARLWRGMPPVPPAAAVRGRRLLAVEDVALRLMEGRVLPDDPPDRAEAAGALCFQAALHAAVAEGVLPSSVLDGPRPPPFPDEARPAMSDPSSPPSSPSPDGPRVPALRYRQMVGAASLEVAGHARRRGREVQVVEEVLRTMSSQVLLLHAVLEGRGLLPLLLDEGDEEEALP